MSSTNDNNIISYFNLSKNTGPSSCSQAFPSPMDLRQMTLEVNINDVQSRSREQRLFPNITFTCNGSITKWIVGAEQRNDEEQLRPELQIWRRISLDTYTKISFNFLTPNVTSYPNVHEYIPNPPLEFQEGDILGVYQPTTAKELRVYYQEDTGPVNYREYAPSGAPSTFDVNDGPDSQYYYPLVSVETLPGDSICVKLTVFSDNYTFADITVTKEMSTTITDGSTTAHVQFTSTTIEVTVTTSTGLHMKHYINNYTMGSHKIKGVHWHIPPRSKERGVPTPPTG